MNAITALSYALGTGKNLKVTDICSLSLLKLRLTFIALNYEKILHCKKFFHKINHH